MKTEEFKNTFKSCVARYCSDYVLNMPTAHAEKEPEIRSKDRGKGSVQQLNSYTLVFGLGFEGVEESEKEFCYFFAQRGAQVVFLEGVDSFAFG